MAISFTHLRGFESSRRKKFSLASTVLPTYVGLNLPRRLHRRVRIPVLPTYVGLNLGSQVRGGCVRVVLPTYVGLNPYYSLTE